MKLLSSSGKQDAADCGFQIQRYHADNGVFAVKAFMEDCVYKDQKLQYSAFNTHHQNRAAERYIKTITNMARAMLIHCPLLWPKQNKLEHWSIANGSCCFGVEKLTDG